MTEESRPDQMPPHQPRTPEQHAAVRRRALPVGLAAAILGAAGVALLLAAPVSAFVPPNLMGVNLASCAILMGAGILFYAKGTPGTRVAAVMSVAGIVLGMAGMLVYTRQAVNSRQVREKLELANVAAIAQGAATYAATHDGAYPADLLVLLETQDLKPQALQSPYGQRNPLFDHFPEAQARAARPLLLTSVETASDYLYLGGDLKAVPPALAGDVLVAASTTTVMRESYALAFADGTSRYITVDEAPQVMAACDAARKKMGLEPLKPPAIIQAALDEAKAGKKPE